MKHWRDKMKTDSELPPSWVKSTIGESMHFIGGGTPSKKIAAYWKGDIPWASVKDLTGECLESTVDHISKEGLRESASNLANPGDILLCTRIIPGKAVISKIKAAINQDLKIVRPHSGLAPLFCKYYFDRIRHNILAQSSGTTVSGITLGVLSAFDMPVPPLAEQERIVARLEELFSDLDRSVEELRHAQQLLLRYRASLLHAAVTGRLTETWRKQHGPAKESGYEVLKHIITERKRQWEDMTLYKYNKEKKLPPANWQDRYKEPSTLSQNNQPGDTLPEGWVWATNDQLMSTITSGSRDWSPYYGHGSGTFIMAQNVRMGKLDLSYRQAVSPPPNHRDCARSQVEEHDLLVTIVGANTGEVCRVSEPLPEHYVCQSVALMRPVLHQLSKWLLVWFTAQTGAQRQFDKYVYGAGRPHLSFEHLEQVFVPLPPSEEQIVILEIIHHRLSKIDDVESKIEGALASADLLKYSFLKSAFEGKLVSQDSKDEPAEALLSRLRAESASAPVRSPRSRRSARK